MALAPNVFGAMAEMGILPKNGKENLDCCHGTGLLSLDSSNTKTDFLEPTEKERILFLFRIWKFMILNLKTPDTGTVNGGCLLFDIPERIKVYVNAFCATLVAIGFVRLQDSVWVFPYDCEDLITLLKADFKISEAVLYMIVETLENDASLKSILVLRNNRGLHTLNLRCSGNLTYGDKK